MSPTLALSLSPLARTRIQALVASTSPRRLPVIVFDEDVELPRVEVAVMDPDLALEFQEEYEARGENFLFQCDGLEVGVSPGGWEEYLDGKVLDCESESFWLR